MARAVSDSSVLIHLALIGRLELLSGSFEGVCIPAAVWEEVVVQGESRPGVEAVREAARCGWIRVQAVVNTPLVQSLRQTLHAGEAEAIALAVEAGPDVLLIDENDARAVARALGLRTHGVIGVLVEAKAAGRLTAIRPVLEELIGSGFFLAPALVARILHQVGEAT